ncbi:hypothetical protein MMC18_006283 [Xylographa bjoerkii]|nr:hypothetical protein [Xylographa bjoerkii]
MGDGGEPDETSNGDKVLLEVNELDELELVELGTIVETKEPDEVEEYDEVECGLGDDEAELLLLVLLLLVVVGIGVDDDDVCDVANISLLLKVATVAVARDVAGWELLILLVLVEDDNAETAILERMLPEVSRGMIVDDAAIESLLLELVRLEVRLAATEEEVLVDSDLEEDENVEYTVRALVD